MPGQVLSFGDEFRDFEVADRVVDERTFTDAVPITRRPRPRRYIALLSFDEDRITHVALAIRGSRVATGMVRIRYEHIQELTPVTFSAIAESISPRLSHHFTSNLYLDGWLPEQTWRATLDIIRQDALNNRVILELERRLSNRLVTLDSPQLQVLTEERDAVGLALQIFNPSSSTIVPDLSLLSTPNDPFLVALQGADMPEDFGIDHDTNVFDEWVPAGIPAAGARTFERDGKQLTVANVNRTSIEHVLGVDLIYFHAEYKSFVFVQYKRMRRDDERQSYYRPTGNSYRRQHKQMTAWDNLIRAHSTSPDLRSYRLGSDAFFFKIYANPIGALTSDRLLKGMYFPLSYWNALVASPEALGPRGGVRITYDNAGRYFNNTAFTGLVGNGWVGSPPQGEMMLANVIAQALGSRHSVTLAVAQQAEQPSREPAFRPIGRSDLG